MNHYHIKYKRNGLSQSMLVEASHPIVAERYFEEKRPSAEVLEVRKASPSELRPGIPKMVVPKEYEEEMDRVLSDLRKRKEKTNSILWKEDMISEVVSLICNVPDWQVPESDVILANLLQAKKFDIFGLTLNFFDIWKNSTDKKAVEQIFYAFTDMEFDRFLMKCQKEIVRPEKSLAEKIEDAFEKGSKGSDEVLNKELNKELSR